jgi:hypothetical protein
MLALQYDPNRPEDVLKVDVDDDGAGGGLLSVLGRDEVGDNFPKEIAGKSGVN